MQLGAQCLQASIQLAIFSLIVKRCMHEQVSHKSAKLVERDGLVIISIGDVHQEPNIHGSKVGIVLTKHLRSEPTREWT